MAGEVPIFLKVFCMAGLRRRDANSLGHLSALSKRADAGIVAAYVDASAVAVAERRVWHRNDQSSRANFCLSVLSLIVCGNKSSTECLFSYGGFPDKLGFWHPDYASIFPLALSYGFGKTPASSARRPMPPPKKLSVLIIHHAPVTRFGLTMLIKSSRHFEVIGESGEAPVARRLFAQNAPDLVVLSLTLYHGDGISLLKDFKKMNPAARALVVTARNDSLSVQRAFKAGGRAVMW
jgi:two-component system, chemotaxis family, chemotaxis protein CheY